MAGMSLRGSGVQVRAQQQPQAGGGEGASQVCCFLLNWATCAACRQATHLLLEPIALEPCLNHPIHAPACSTDQPAGAW